VAGHPGGGGVSATNDRGRGNSELSSVVEETANYLHAECASALFGFVDDLELHLRESNNIVAIRSASRVGYSDLGVNRRRVEGLREALRARGIVR
jgi:uncharacterized protein (DUF1499 family)